ncbi:hypothetical protein EZY14_009510 [Kordia sp. TARA_039_SRF]|nr:hypothetical protein EZY14_009510 [Kordia sp. TARA_039_SRF]
MNKNLLQYSLNVAATIAELYSNNNDYIEVRSFFPKQDLHITDDFRKAMLRDNRFSVDDPIFVIIAASHETYNNSNAMKPEIRLEYIPEKNKTYICTAYISSEFNDIIDDSITKEFEAEDLGRNLYNLMIETQHDFKKELK